MQTDSQKPMSVRNDDSKPGCGVSSAFNFSVGAAALIAFLLFSYLLYSQLR